MPKPTKFDLMRAGRERAMRANAEFGFVPLPQVPAEPEPAAPFMEIDGVRYVEASETGGVNHCSGCAFASDSCHWSAHHLMRARIAFGGDCAERQVIYLKA